jgi:hypothetical protein
LYLVGYTAINVYTRLLSRRRPDAAWEIATSTKEISAN